MGWGIHSYLLLDLQMLSDLGQALLGCHLWGGSLLIRGGGGIWGKKKEGGEALIPMLLSIKVETHRAPA